MPLVCSSHATAGEHAVCDSNMDERFELTKTAPNSTAPAPNPQRPVYSHRATMSHEMSADLDTVDLNNHSHHACSSIRHATRRYHPVRPCRKRHECAHNPANTTHVRTSQPRYRVPTANIATPLRRHVCSAHSRGPLVEEKRTNPTPPAAQAVATEESSQNCSTNSQLRRISALPCH